MKTGILYRLHVGSECPVLFRDLFVIFPGSSWAETGIGNGHAKLIAYDWAHPGADGKI